MFLICMILDNTKRAHTGAEQKYPHTHPYTPYGIQRNE